jgi:nucleoside-diphosphate-sugar epimerase
MEWWNMRALVTGGTGFLGSRLAVRLQELGWEVTAVGRNEVKGLQLKSSQIRFVSLDLRNKAEVIAACQGQDAVFHCAALSAPWGAFAEFYASNVDATEHVIAGSIKHQVARFIHVSTPSVYFDFTPRLDVSERDPLPVRFANAYAHTKRLAELAVERAVHNGLPAVTIRPRAIFGPGDNSIIPRLIRANESRGVPIINGGRALVDLTFVDNVVDALLCCQAAPDHVIGRTYNITNGEPVPFVEALQMLFTKLDSKLKARRIPYRVAYALASAMELSAKLLQRDQEPLLTRYVVGILGLSQTLDITAAKEELGYVPRVSIESGMEAFAHSWGRSLSL